MTKGIETQFRASDSEVKINGQLARSICDQNASSKVATQYQMKSVGDVITALLAEQSILKSIKPGDIKIEDDRGIGAKYKDDLKEAIKTLERHRAEV